MEIGELEEWGISIIQQVKKERIRFRNNPLEFSIFYSPLTEKPKLMIIGDNRGGQLIGKDLDHIPKSYEYLETSSIMQSCLRHRYSFSARGRRARTVVR